MPPPLPTLRTPGADDSSPLSFAAAARVWLRIGLLSFGGPAGQIALMHKELVEERKWIGEKRYLHALNYCMLLPGPEAQQLATYIGWLLHGVKGGVVAGGLFVLPGALLLLVLSGVYVELHDVPFIAGLFFGLKAAVLAVVTEALVRIGKRALKSGYAIAVAGTALVALGVFAVPFPLLIVSAGILGAVAARARPAWFPASTASGGEDGENVVDAMAARGELGHTQPSSRKLLTTALVCAALWAAPVIVVVMVSGADSVLAREGTFFSQAAVVTFGGAYAVLAWVGQRAVALSWLSPREMLDGLALAETTPGPLILVLEFVAFVAAYRHVTGVPPLVAGALGAALMLWVTFLPSMTWIFVGAPYVERLRGKKSLDGALATITAAVVGVIANLSLFLALHALFTNTNDVAFGPAGLMHVTVPDVSSLDAPMLALTALSFVLLFAAKLGLARTLAIVGALGCAWQLLLRR